MPEQDRLKRKKADRAKFAKGDSPSVQIRPLPSLSKLLKQTMAERKISQVSLAALTGVTQGYISSIITGKFQPKKPLKEVFLRKLAQALHLPMEVVSNAAGVATVVEAKRPTLIGFSGGSGAGKSFLAEHIQRAHHQDVAVIELDGYYKPTPEVVRLDGAFDNPEAINYQLAATDLEILRSGHERQIPHERDYRTGMVSFRTQKPKPLLIVEGHLLFYDKTLREKLDLLVWIEAGDGIRVERRIKRDIMVRELELGQVLEQINKEVRPSYEKHVHPLMNYADIVILNDENNNKALRALPLLLAYVQTASWALPVSWSHANASV
jgi:uridine kinase